MQECDVLARSMKEWERRPSERSGFSDHPGDCLAFKYLRDVSVCSGALWGHRKVGNRVRVFKLQVAGTCEM